MAETWTIKPAGGGNYSDLATAEAAKQGSLTGRGIVTFECYDGGDCGVVTYDGWSNADSSNHVQVIPAAANFHDGTTISAGAYITVPNGSSGIIALDAGGCHYLQVNRMRLMLTAGGSSVNGFSLTANNVTLDGNLIIASGTQTGGTLTGLLSQGNNLTRTITIQNNSMYGTGAKCTGLNVRCRSTSTSNNTVTEYIYNNTVDNCDSTGEGGFLFVAAMTSTGTATLNVTSIKNVGTNSAGGDFIKGESGGGTVNITQTYSISSDATADDWGGAGNQINLASSTLYVASGSNHQVKVGGALQNGGTAIATVPTDCLGVSRPQGAADDVGAYELVTATLAGVFYVNNRRRK